MPCSINPWHPTDDPHGGPCSDCLWALDVLHDLSEEGSCAAPAAS